MRRLRQLASATGALTTALVLLVLAAPPSAAGGPGSVLLVSPTSRRTASSYGTDRTYARLEELLPQAGSELDERPAQAPDRGAEDTWMEQVRDMVTVSWTLPDSRPWRTDDLYTSVSGTEDIWIHTTLQLPQDTASSGVGGWHRAKRSEELRALLDGLGVLRAASGEPQGAAASADALADTGVGVGGTAADPRATTDPPGLIDRARWVVPALALGLLLGFEGATLRRRRSAARHGPAPSREPRQELLDS
ncbi:hypothetical protein PYK79_19265 [Streptomyces sp. ID05-04B]|uniref:hypothetical protein n=1 Tax=unclassified Streptomyces TaxID=2593676 RepID=UPI000D1BDB4F|nr:MULTISPECIES: hypothetical protein [unclassified Streptomyces]AVV47142.1 hypothetical protein C6376_43295 [Streptomyces sp. P3]MDX5565026.1 hypothetical protein [Streptomyces sp. ID05-04B]